MIRIGKISKIDLTNGMAAVVYEDKEDATTGMLPIMKPLSTGAFVPPSIGDFVVVGHLNNGTTRGVILGTYYNGENKPE